MTFLQEPSNPSPDEPSAHTAAEFDTLFEGEHRSGAFARVARLVDPTLPDDIEPFSFLSLDLLRHVADLLGLRSGDVLADLGCGRGGPGRWLVRAAQANVVGVDFSPVAVAQARQRASASGMGRSARYVTADLAATPLSSQSVTAVVAIDAMQYAPDRVAAAAEARRVLRRGGHLVVTGWHPHTPGDSRLPPRHRTTDWPAVLHAAGFAAVRWHTRAAWTDTWVRFYRTALQMGDPANDTALAGLQGEARRRLPTALLLRRVITAAVAT